MRYRILTLILMLFVSMPAAAQEYYFTTPNNIHLYAGPGTTYPLTQQLNINQPYNIQSRNPLGNWVEITHAQDETLTGWVQTGSLLLGADVVLSSVPVSNLPDADLSRVEESIPEILFTTPILPETIDITGLQELYRYGQNLGNNPNNVVKIGDCNTAAYLFLTPISQNAFSPGPYGHLTDTVAFYGESFGRDSVAARDGFNVSSIFDPFWAVSEDCNPNESPLACEYRMNPASIAFIMFGQNDVLVLNRDQYRSYLKQTIDESLERGVIPVLSTFTNDPENTDHWDQIIAMNVITIEVAQEYNIPLINFWLAARSLPSYGIGDDYAHLTAGGESIAFTEGREALFGLTLYNLAVLNVLDMIHHDVIEPIENLQNSRNSR